MLDNQSVARLDWFATVTSRTFRRDRMDCRMSVRSILRFAFDIGTNSIGWVVLLGTTTLPSGATRQGQATKIIGVRALGARIYSDGRNPKDGSSLAMMRRVPKAARRRRLREEASSKALRICVQRAEAIAFRTPRHGPHDYNAGCGKRCSHTSSETFVRQAFGRILLPIRKRKLR